MSQTDLDINPLMALNCAIQNAFQYLYYPYIRNTDVSLEKLISETLANLLKVYKRHPSPLSLDELIDITDKYKINLKTPSIKLTPSTIIYNGCQRNMVPFAITDTSKDESVLIACYIHNYKLRFTEVEHNKAKSFDWLSFLDFYKKAPFREEKISFSTSKYSNIEDALADSIKQTCLKYRIPPVGTMNPLTDKNNHVRQFTIIGKLMNQLNNKSISIQEQTPLDSLIAYTYYLCESFPRRFRFFCDFYGKTKDNELIATMKVKGWMGSSYSIRFVIYLKHGKLRTRVIQMG